MEDVRLLITRPDYIRVNASQANGYIKPFQRTLKKEYD